MADRAERGFLASALFSAEQAPPESGLAALVPSAHIERWLKFFMDGDPEGGRRWARRADVLEEVREAWERSFGTAPRAGGRWAPDQRNRFAAAFWMLDDLDSARRELEAVRGVVTEVPWGYWEADAVAAFDKARRACGLLK